jgi:hypothetical protein
MKFSFVRPSGHVMVAIIKALPSAFEEPSFT